jgi:hypothetical protein
MVREALVGNARPLFAVLFGAVAFVLLIACSNLATLLSLHGVSRRREIAIRAAIGAERSRIVRQLLTESLLLSLCGGALALAVAWFAMRLLLFMGLSGVPRLNDVTTVTLDWRVVAFAVAVSIATGVLFGLISVSCVACRARRRRIFFGRARQPRTSSTETRGRTRRDPGFAGARLAHRLSALHANGVRLDQGGCWLRPRSRPDDARVVERAGFQDGVEMKSFCGPSFSSD